MMRVLDLFSGIGGFSLGLERTGGFKTVAFCEIDPFCRRVLAKHWPEVKQYEDVRTLDAPTLQRDGIAVDVITGGFPCQDVSHAGNRAGMEGARSGLWREFARLIGELRPRHVLLENVPGLLDRGMDEVLGALAALRYDAVWDCVPASAVRAPHQRDRVWLVAYAQEQPRHEARSAEAKCGARERRPQESAGGLHSADARGRSAWMVEPAVPRVVDGLSDEMDDERVACVGALGNAVVPQIPELIGRAILQAERAA